MCGDCTQGIYLIYLYVGSIAVIICIYIWVLADSCASMHHDSDAEPTITTSVIGDAELGGLTLTRFGSLKRAHLSRHQASGTSFYLRIGALGTLQYMTGKVGSSHVEFGEPLVGLVP